MSTVKLGSVTREVPSVTPAPQGQRPKVLHLFWVEEEKVARELGIEFKQLCGLWRLPLNRQTHGPSIVERVGIVPISKPQHCRNCVRVLEATWRRQASQGYRY